LGKAVDVFASNFSGLGGQVLHCKPPAVSAGFDPVELTDEDRHLELHVRLR
jgi:hypothetical protein